MSLQENRKEAYERIKIRRTHFWIVFGGFLVVAAALMYSIAPKDSFDWFSIFFYDVTQETYYFYPMAVITLALWFYWYGNPFNVILKKIGVYEFVNEWVYKWPKMFLEIILPSGVAETITRSMFGTESKFSDLDKFFYPAPVKDDSIEKVPLNEFVVFKGKYNPYTLFDFSVENLDERDEKGTDRIIGYFRGENFDERSERYIDLFSIIEGRFVGWKKMLTIADKPSPFRIRADKGRVAALEVDMNRDVYDPIGDRIFISPRMIMETVQITSYLFNRYIDVSLAKGTKIRRLYGDVLKDRDVRGKVNDFFKFFFWRKLLINYGSIPSGWVVIRADDYDFRRVASSIDRELVISIRDNNRGIGNSPDDRFASMFLFLWHAFFTKSIIREQLADMLWLFDPLKSLSEMKIKKEMDLNEQRISEEIDHEKSEERK